MAIPSAVMRNIARHEIETMFPGLPPSTVDDCVTSVIRQWITNDRNAGVFSLSANYWLHLSEQEGKAVVRREACHSNMKAALGQWRIVDRDLPDVVRQLTIAQSATFVNAVGVYVRVTADPKEHSFRFGEVKVEDEIEGSTR